PKRAGETEAEPKQSMLSLKGTAMPGDINLNQLKAFYYAAKCGGITRAAETLCITQPAVSLQIKALEAHYDVQLFVRRRKRLELTPLGKRLYEVCTKAFTHVGEAELLLMQAKQFAGDILKIGSTKTLVRYLLARYIARFQESFPKVQIELDEGKSEAMVQSVLEHRNDIAIVGRVPYDPDLTVIPFLEDELVLLAAPEHRLAAEEEVSLRDIRDETFILREKGSGTRRLIEQVFQKAGIVSSAFIETGNVDFIKQMVKIGKGLALLARMGVDRDFNNGELKAVKLTEGPFVLGIDIVVNRRRTLSELDKAFLDVLLEGKAAGRPALRPLGGSARS
ncbi:LysR substrate-binding domain-containing protein, partial [Thermodesulfobacteriota bacterium]